MSGHSKWSKIKHQKGVNDAKRGQMFTKFGHNITLAARDGGGDPEMNFKLRMAIDKAKEANMPQNNIDRAVKRGTGELKDAAEIQEITYEAYGPQGVPMLIDVITDNSNRTVADVRKAISAHGGSVGEAGSVSWQFKEVGLITIRPATKKKSEKHGKADEIVEMDIDEVTLELMDIDGVLDIDEIDVEDNPSKKYKGLEIMSERAKLSSVHKQIEEKGYIVISAEMIKIPNTTVEVNPETNQKIDNVVEALEDLDEVQAVWDARKR